MSSATISSINVEDLDSWREPIFITIDIDWADDKVIDDTADLIEEAGAAATWFMTHDTPVIERLRANPQWEIGIHPNFNFLLAGDPTKGSTIQEVIENVIALVPNATSVRSHSLVQGTPIHTAFVASGLTHDCNDLVPADSRIDLAPWHIAPGLTKVPHFWEDDVCFALPTRPCIKKLTERPGLKVFDFHPIHVCLNSVEYVDYESARAHFGDYDALFNRRRDSPDGARSALIKLLDTIS